MIQVLRVQGFKAFGREVRVDLGQVNALLGKNSAGKSTLAQALACLRDSFAGTELPRALALLRGERSLGRWGAVAHRGWTEPCWIGVEGGPRSLKLVLDPPVDAQAQRAPVAGIELGSHLKLLPEAAQGVDALVTWRVRPVGEPPAWLSARGRDAFRVWRGPPEREENKGAPEITMVVVWRGDVPTWTVTGVDDPTNDGGAWEAAEGADAEEAGPSWSALFDWVKREVVFHLGLRAALDRFVHLGPLRSPGGFLHDPLGADRRGWDPGWDGRHWLSLLQEPGDKGRLNQLLKEAEFGFQVDWRDAELELPALEVYLWEDEAEDPRGIPNVGIGIGQVLPFLACVVALTRERGDPSLLWCEQPELHLHPRLQARLATFLAQALKSQEGTPGLQVVAETHSEHFVLALAIQVREKVLEPEALQLLAITRFPTGAPEVVPIAVDPRGDFQGYLPDGFFPERYDLLQGRIP